MAGSSGRNVRSARERRLLWFAGIGVAALVALSFIAQAESGSDPRRAGADVSAVIAHRSGN